MANESDESTSEKGAAEAELAVTDALIEVAARKPDEFHATVDALTPYVVEHDDGLFAITAPDEVIKAVDQDSYAALRDSLDKANQDMQEDALSLAPPLPRIPWSAIFRLVKSTGKWVWYKVGNCTAAVVRNWTDITTHSADPMDWAKEAAIVCGIAMRR